MKKLILICALATLGATCGDDAADGATAADTLTRAQKDSIVADMPIPGAGAVGAAMQARDRAEERAAAHDSIG